MKELEPGFGFGSEVAWLWFRAGLGFALGFALA